MPNLLLLNLMMGLFTICADDVRMPGMSGIELHAFILKKMPAMRNKIIFITGDVIGADIKDFLMQNNLSYFANRSILKL